MPQISGLNFLGILAVMLCCAVLFAFFEKPTLALPFMVSCLSLLTVFHSYQRKEIAGFVQILFFVFVVSTLVVPFLFLVLFVSEVGIQNYYGISGLQPPDLLLSNCIVLTFLLGVRFFLLLFDEAIPKKQLPGSEQPPDKLYCLDVDRLIIILFISISAKLYLIATGGWFISNSDFESGMFSHSARVLEKLDLFVYFILIFKKKVETISQGMVVILFIFVPITFAFAVMSGSKEKIFVQGVVVLLYLVTANYKKLVFASSAVILMFAPSIFEAVNTARSGLNQGLSVSEISERILLRSDRGSVNLEDRLIFRRLDYTRALAVVVRESPMFPSDIKTDYLDNFIGLIPRLLWHSKPNIGIDYNEVGRELRLLHPTDFTTSAGISPLGEAYRQFGFLGLPLLAFFSGLLLAVSRRLFSERKMFGFATAGIIALTVAPMNSYMTLLPVILKIVLVLLVMRVFLEKPQNTKRGSVKA